MASVLFLMAWGALMGPTAYGKQPSIMAQVVANLLTMFSLQSNIFFPGLDCPLPLLTLAA